MDVIEITDHDFIRLRDMLEFELRHIEDNDRRENLRFLDSQLRQGKVISSRNVPADIVIMGAWVRLKDLDSHEQFSYTLVYPDMADIEQGRLSVLAPLGVAVLGRRENDLVEWNAPDGTRRLKIEAVRHYAKPNKA